MNFSTKKAGRIGNWLSCGSKGKIANIACSREVKPSFTFKTNSEFLFLQKIVALDR